MKFDDFVMPDAICAKLAAEDKEGVIREMVQSLLEAKAVESDQVEDIVEAVCKREELGSTGIGRGVAVPHAKHPTINRLVATAAISEEGVDFDSLDGEKVHLFFLLISPNDRPGDHLRALEYTARQLRKDTFCRFLRQANNREEIQQLLEEADNNQLEG